MRYKVYNEDKSQVLKESPDTGAEFVLKEGVPLPALLIVLKTMKKGEKASLVLKAGCERAHLVSAVLVLHIVTLCPLSIVYCLCPHADYTVYYAEKAQLYNVREPDIDEYCQLQATSCSSMLQCRSIVRDAMCDDIMIALE